MKRSIELDIWNFEQELETITKNIDKATPVELEELENKTLKLLTKIRTNHASSKRTIQ